MLKEIILHFLRKCYFFQHDEVEEIN